VVGGWAAVNVGSTDAGGRRRDMVAGRTTAVRGRMRAGGDTRRGMEDRATR
jgi:hypothetical protein